MASMKVLRALKTAWEMQSSREAQPRAAPYMPEHSDDMPQILDLAKEFQILTVRLASLGFGPVEILGKGIVPDERAIEEASRRIDLLRDILSDILALRRLHVQTQFTYRTKKNLATSTLQKVRNKLNKQLKDHESETSS